MNILLEIEISYLITAHISKETNWILFLSVGLAFDIVRKIYTLTSFILISSVAKHRQYNRILFVRNEWRIHLQTPVNNTLKIISRDMRCAALGISTGIRLRSSSSPPPASPERNIPIKVIITSKRRKQINIKKSY